MTNVKPSDLTELEWLLLRHLQQYTRPFYTEELYAQFSKYHISGLEFYRLFFMLAALSYIQLESIGELVPGQKQDFCYVMTPKGRNMFAKPKLSVVMNTLAMRWVKATSVSLTKTIVLENYMFNF